MSELVGFAARAFLLVNPTAAAIIFAVIAASGFRIPGVTVLDALTVGSGHVALNPIALKG